MKKEVLIALSGGADSTTLLAHLLNKGYNVRSEEHTSELQSH